MSYSKITLMCCCLLLPVGCGVRWHDADLEAPRRMVGTSPLRLAITISAKDEDVPDITAAVDAVVAEIRTNPDGAIFRYPLSLGTVRADRRTATWNLDLRAPGWRAGDRIECVVRYAYRGHPHEKRTVVTVE